MAKLVAFYSRADENYFGGSMKYIQIGNTEKAAKMIADMTGADLFKIEQKISYAADYNTCIAQAKEDKQTEKRPEILNLPQDIDQYDEIYLGYPNYWGNAYVNERAVGRAIKDSGIDRKNIFLSTKIWASEYENENTVEETLERLGVDYVDLLYIHQPAGNWLAGYRMLEKAYREGKAKSIGISNFEGKYMEELETKWEIVPQFIQVEAHPYFTQKELRVTLDKYGIKLMSWYPLGHGDTALMNELVFAGLGKKYGKTPAQVILRWHTQMGFVVIPGSKNAEHIKDNMDIFDFALTDEEMEQIAKLDKNERYYHRTDEQLVQFANWKPEFEK
ncbi:aldo/keto reductase [Lacrimispora saccharolytica]|nr:aldo/keto reductase [Lacrimispora saccharolytica]